MSALRETARAGAIAVVLLAVLAGRPAEGQEAVIVVRHAEKVDESDDPDLSTKGRARAEALARILGKAGVDAIYVTQYKRTGQTAAPLARALGIQPQSLHSDAVQELVKRLRADHARDVVLVVSHSGSVPRILEQLGHPEPVTIGHHEYDGLYLVVPRKGEPPRVLRLSLDPGEGAPPK